MKQILTLIAFLLVGCAAQAQSTSTPAIDSTSGSETIYLYTPDGYLGKNDVLQAAQYVGTEISGTTGGTISFQVTLDGTNYYQVGDTLALADVTTAQTIVWQFPSYGVLKGRIKIAATGTSSQHKGYFIKKSL